MILRQPQLLTYQETVDFIRKLYQRKILSYNGKRKLLHQSKQMKQHFPKGYKITKYHLLRMCGAIFDEELYYRAVLYKGQVIENAIQGAFPKDGIGFWGVGNSQDYSKHPLIHKEQSVFGKHLDKIANDLLEIGFISTTVYATLKQTIEDPNNEFRFEGHLIRQAAHLQEAYDNFDIEKEKQLKFIIQLLEAGLMTTEQQKVLLASYKPNKLKTHFEILSYCSKVVLFTTDDYSKNHQAFYRHLLDLVRGILPEFVYEDIQFEVFPRQDQYLDMKMSLWCKGVKYQHLFTYGLLRTEGDNHRCSYHDVDKKYGIFDLEAGFHRIVNKFLADQASPFRLYFVQNQQKKFIASTIMYDYPTNQCAFILQTHEQAKFWEGATQYIGNFMSKEHHTTLFNTQNLKRLADFYDEIGLFRHLTDEEKATALEKIKTFTITKYIDVLAAYGCILRILWDEPNCYTKALQQISKISCEVFNPQQVIEKIEIASTTGNKELAISFLWNNKLYQFHTYLDNDYLAWSFYSFINKILAEQDTDLSIYFQFEESDPILLTKQQAKILRKEQPELFYDE